MNTTEIIESVENGRGPSSNEPGGAANTAATRSVSTRVPAPLQRVLIVEPNPELSALIEEVASLRGLDRIAVRSGREAIQLVRDGVRAIMIVDGGSLEDADGDTVRRCLVGMAPEMPMIYSDDSSLLVLGVVRALDDALGVPHPTPTHERVTPLAA